MKESRIAKIHLLGHALNMLIKEKLIDMDSIEDKDSDHIECEVLGKSSLISWAYIGFGEIRLTIWWNFDKTRHPQHSEGGFKGRVIWDELSEEEQHKLLIAGKRVHRIRRTMVEGYRTCQPLVANNARYKDFVGVMCSLFVERKTGKYLQTDGCKVEPFGSYVRAQDRQPLCSIPNCEPKGFRLDGRMH